LEVRWATETIEREAASREMIAFPADSIRESYREALEAFLGCQTKTSTLFVERKAWAAFQAAKRSLAAYRVAKTAYRAATGLALEAYWTYLLEEVADEMVDERPFVEAFLVVAVG
jgi:hypothetical protein